MHHVKANIENPVRFSVSLNRDDYDALNRVADKNDVSMAWLVRKAVEKFVNSDLQRELFPDQKVREVVRS
jgi:predicted transcriptional regulator